MSQVSPGDKFSANIWKIICNLCKLIGVCPAISFYIFRENYEFYYLSFQTAPDNFCPFTAVPHSIKVQKQCHFVFNTVSSSS